jgi:predicted DNA-binding transcriptional regulator YafY
LDKIVDIRITENPIKPMRKVKGLENGLSLPTHMAEHIYMFSGKSIRVTFKAQRYLSDEIIDWFGLDTVFSNVTDDDILVTVKVNENAIFYWLLQYGQHVQVLEPKELRNRVAETIEEIIKNTIYEHH